MRLVLSIYPQQFRSRYEEEILDLLTHSRAPVSDLADIAVCALADRGEEMTMTMVRARGPRPVSLLAAPLAFGAALLAYASLAVLAIGMIDQGADQEAIQIAIASAILPVGALAVWFGLRSGRRRQIASPSLVIPTMLAIGTVIIAGIPIVGETLGEYWSATALAVLCWAVMTVAVATTAAVLLRKSRRSGALALMILGSLLILEITFLVYSLAVPSTMAPSVSPIWWYPAAITGLNSDDGTNVLEVLKGLPAVLTVCTLFTFAAVGAGETTERHAAPGRPVSQPARG